MANLKLTILVELNVSENNEAVYVSSWELMFGGSKLFVLIKVSTLNKYATSFDAREKDTIYMFVKTRNNIRSAY